MKQSMDDKILMAKNYSLAAHVIQIQQASEQWLRQSSKNDLRQQKNEAAGRPNPHQDPSKGSLSAGRHAQIAGATLGGSSPLQHGGPQGPGGQGSAGTGAVGASAAADIMSSDLQIDGEVMMAGGTDILDEADADHLGSGQQELDQQANNAQKTLDLLDVYIDAKDSVNNWCVARIIDHDLQNHKLQLHFDGWSNKYDETVRIGSSRIAAFRKYTQGYTGQSKMALRDFDMNYAYQVTMLNRIQRATESSFLCFTDATECTQFIRGEMYLYFDSLITLVLEATQADVQKIFEFTTEVFRLCLRWVEIFPKYQEVFKMCSHHSNLFLVDLSAAICSCGYEVFDMMQKCFGLCERSNKFFRQQIAAINYQGEFADPSKMPENGLMLSLVNKFGELGGFVKLQDLIKIGATGTDFRCPVTITSWALQTFTKLQEIGVKASVILEISKNVASHVEERLKPENLPDTEIKEVHLEELKLLIRLMAHFKSCAEDCDRHRVVELYGLEIAKRFLTCPYFENRIKGMKEFKLIQEKVLNRVTRTPQDCRQLGQDYAKFLDLRIFSDWVHENKVIDFIFKENPHSELIKRSYSILYILAQDTETFPEEMVALIWSCCSSEKHEDIHRATYELITQLAKCLPQQGLKSLFQRVKTIGLPQIDGRTIVFLRDYTINAIENLKEQKSARELPRPGTGKGTHQSSSTSSGQNQSQSSTSGGGITQMFSRASGSSHGKKTTIISSLGGGQSSNRSQTQQAAANEDESFYNLMMFWDVAQDANTWASHRTKELALKSLIDVLKLGQTYKSDIRDQFVQLALDNIKKGDSVYFAIGFLQQLLGTYPHDDQLQAGGNTSSQGGRQRQGGRNSQQTPVLTIESLISTILKKVDLYQNVIAAAALYMKSTTPHHKENKLEDAEGASASGAQSEGNSLSQIDSAASQTKENRSSTSASGGHNIHQQQMTKGGISHEEYINVFMNFMEFIVINSRTITLQFQHVQEMFKIFVTDAITEVETREFFNFLTKQNQNARSRERLYLLDEKLRFQVFTKIMCNEKSMNCLNLNLQAYECFRTLFVGVNAQEGTLTPDSDGNILAVSNFPQVQGLNTMWKIAIHCQNEDVKDMCRSLLCDTFLLTKSKTQSQRLKVHDQFIKTCRQHLANAQAQWKESPHTKEHNIIIFNCLRLIKTFILRFDKEHIVGELKQALDRLSPQERRNTRRVGVKLDPGGARTEVEVNLNCTFWELMRQCGELLDLKLSEFYIFTKQGPLPDHIYNHYMKDYDLTQVQFERVPQDRMEKEFPSYVIGYHRECLDVFLEVLSNRDDAITNEVISLIELLQINPKIKNYLNDKICKLKAINTKQNQAANQEATSTDTAATGGEDLQQFNFKDWSLLLRWEGTVELNQTLYMLTCLKELTSGKPGQLRGFGGASGNSNMTSAPQERLARLELQKAIVSKGGFHFLLYMFNNVNKEADFEKDILTSKTLQLLITLLNQLHSVKLQPILSAFEKPQHLTELIEGCLVIVSSFLKSVIAKQQVRYDELVATQKQLMSQGNGTGPSPLDTEVGNLDLVYNQLQHQAFGTTILTAALSFLVKILSTYPSSFSVLQNNDKFYQMLNYGLIDICQRKVQEKISDFSQTLSTKIEQLMINHLKAQSKTAKNATQGGQAVKVELLDDNATSLPSYLILRTMLKKFMPLSLKERNIEKMRTHFKLLNAIFSETKVYKSLEKIEAPQQLTDNIIRMIYEREIREATSRDEDVVVAGLFEFLGQILVRFPEVRQTLAEKKKLIQFLTHQGLFKKEKRMMTQQAQEGDRAPKNLPPMCKNLATRNSCLELLRILCLDDLQDKLYVTQYLKQNVCNETFWRTPRKVDWSIHMQQQERALCGYVGLKNLGCICYMNSIMQQLYMIPDFRKAIIEVEDRHHDQQPNEENVLFQLKCIFGGLMEVEKQYFNPKKFCKAFKDIDGSPIDAFVQKDVDEFFNMLMDRIESLIKGTKEEKIMNNLFQGVLANEFICKDCPHYSERQEPFLAISLQVKNKNSVQDSLKFYVEGEMLEGDNAYYCEKCEKKVNTLKRCCIKRMPNVLFLVLKRFEFDFDTMQKVKVNDYCEFPTELDMSPYSQQELARQDLIKQMEEKNLSTDDLNEDQLHILKRKVPENYYKYRLKGIVVHEGTADQGHYYSFIADREKKNSGWFVFNDTLVREFDPADIPEEAYGGDDHNLASNIREMQAQGNGQVDQAMIQAMRQFKTKIKNAYVLIYDREELYDMLKTNDVMDDTKTVTISPKELTKLYSNCRVNHSPSQQQAMALIPQIPHNVHDVLLAKNKKFWHSNTIFSTHFIQQMYRIFKDIKVKQDQDYLKYSSPTFDLQGSEQLDQFEAFKFVIAFFFTVALRSKDRLVLPDYVALIRNALKSNIGLCLWLIETFSNQDFIKEFLIDCPIHDMARFTQGLLKTAMVQVYEQEKDQLAEYIKLLDTPDGVLNFVRETQKEFIEEDIIADGRTQQDVSDTTVCSGCSQINFIRFQAHSTKIPKLVIFMNSFIHMSTSYHCLRKFTMAGQFWSIFSNFSMLGDQARLYLLQTRTLGRLIDIFLNLQQDNFFTKQAINDYMLKFRDQSLRQYVPLFVNSKESYIGIDVERSHILMTNSEKKQIINFISSPKTFIIVTISNLSRSCSLVKQTGVTAGAPPSIFALDQLNYVPDKEEIELLQSQQNFRWWSADHSKLVRNSIALMFAHICTDNREFSADYVNTLINLISQEQSIHVRNYERPLLRVVQVADKYQAERAKRVLQKLYELAKNSVSCFMQMDSIMELITKLSIRCPVFAQQLAKHHGDLYKLVERYSKENPTLPVGTSKIRIFKEGQVRWNDIKFLNQAKLDWITTYVRARTNRLSSHLQKTLQEQQRIATLAGAHDFKLANNRGVQSSAVAPAARPLNESTASDSDLRDATSATAGSDDKATSLQKQHQEELFDSDDDMYNRIFEPGQLIDFSHNNRWYHGVVEIVLDEMVRCVATSGQDNNQPVQWIELESDRLAPPNSIMSNDREQLHKFFIELATYVTASPSTHSTK